MKMLIANGADTMTKSYEGNTSLLKAIAAYDNVNRVKVVEYLLDQPHDINAISTEKFSSYEGDGKYIPIIRIENTALTQALKRPSKESLKIAKLLIDHEASLTICAPLAVIASSWNSTLGKETLDLLIEHGADPAATLNGKSPLVIAIEKNPDMVLPLLKLGSDKIGINDHYENGSTPLMFAAANGLSPIISELLRLGADPQAVDGKNRIALDYALANKNKAGGISCIEKLVSVMKKEVRHHKRPWLKSETILTGYKGTEEDNEFLKSFLN